jgi:hypothetical protein
LLGIHLNLSEKNQMLVMEALDEYANHCTRGKKPIVKLVINRVKKGVDPLDGMYLRTMEEALDHSADRNPILTAKLLRIKTIIQSKREQFQYSSVKWIFQEIS